MRVTICLLTLVIGLVSGSAPPGAVRQARSPVRPFVVDSNWAPMRIDHDSAGDVLHFPNGRRLAPNLFYVEFLGQLPRSHRSPILILGGRDCQDCDAELSVYAIPGDANAFGFTHEDPFPYPGTLRPGGGDTDTTSYYHGRMFIGECLAEKQTVVVWFQQERDSTGHWHPNVYRLSVSGDSAKGAFMQTMPPLANTVRAARTGRCLEVRGADQEQL